MQNIQNTYNTLATTKERDIIESFTANGYNKLTQFVKYVLKENNSHNLIGKSTEKNIWTRHIIDSIQLVPYVLSFDSIVDLGSGAGFPAIVLAIATNKPVVLIEKSPVKANFLQNTCKKLQLQATIMNIAVNKDNIASIIQNNSVITSRAFKSVSNIFSLLQHCQQVNNIVLLKGGNFQTELNECRKQNNEINNWNIDVKNSITGSGVILTLSKKTILP